MSENLLWLVAWIKKISETIIFAICAAAVLLASSQSKKLILYILLLTIVVIDLRKLYTEKEVGPGLELNDVY